MSVEEELVDYLKTFVTQQRWERINQVLDQRTRRLTVVLEDIYQPHNACAVLRSCDCFGIQDVHIIENENTFEPSNGVTIGADQWLTLHTYSRKGVNNTRLCFKHLRENGYRIVVTTPHSEDISLGALDVEEKTALVFGAEYTGASEYALNHADAFVRIPMYGFSESYNISVSAALCMYQISQKLRGKGVNWQLDKDQKTVLRLGWLEQSIRASDQLREQFLKER